METRSPSALRGAWRLITWRLCAAAVLAPLAVMWLCARLAGQQPSERDVVADVRVVGNSTIDLAKVVPYIKTRAGRPYDSQLILEDVRRLNRSRMFASVSTENRREPSGGLIVIFRVVERPTLQYIKYIGLRSALEKNMEDETNLKVGEPVDPYAVSEGKRKIEEYYKAKGFNLVQVTIVEGVKPTDRGAIYVIHEGPQQQISAIEFVGNSIATGQRLKTQIQSGSVWFGYFWGYLDKAKVEEDVRTLEKYYKNLGFLTARVGYDPQFDESQTYCTLRFVIDEGPRCQINSVSFQGVSKFRVEDIEGMLKLKAAQPFDGTMLLRDKSTVEQIYGSYGYVFADVKAEPRVSEDASRMDLVYVIEEGKRYRVADVRVQIEGENPHTNIRTVLNRVELQPGDIVDVRKLRRSEARLQRSQLFHVDPTRGIRPQIVVQPAGELDGEELIGSKKKSGSGTGSFRGQSPDDQPGDVWVPLHVMAPRLNAQPPPSAPLDEEHGLAPVGALPDGRVPPPLKAEPRFGHPVVHPPRNVPAPGAAQRAPLVPGGEQAPLNATRSVQAPVAPRFRSWDTTTPAPRP